MTSKKKPAQLTSLRAYAKLRGVSVEAVSKAVKVGRLRECVQYVGAAPKIADVELANREWDANTQPRIDQPSSTRSVAKPPTFGDDADEEAEDLPAGVPPYKVSRAKREAAAARREDALADIAEIERDEKRDELVPVDEARAFIIDRFAIVKQQLLAVPNRVAQHLPHIASEVQPVVEQYLREVLEELAAEGESGDGEGEAQG